MWIEVGKVSNSINVNKMKQRFYEIVFNDTYVDDYGCYQNHLVKETIEQNNIKWYLENVKFISVKVVNKKAKRKILGNAL